MPLDAPPSLDPVAWRCEHCKKLIPAGRKRHIVFVEEYNSHYSFSGAVRTKGRFVRRMVVDSVCRGLITDIEES